MRFAAAVIRNTSVQTLRAANMLFKSRMGEIFNPQPVREAPFFRPYNA